MVSSNAAPARRANPILRKMKKSRTLYVLFLPVLVYFIVFKYLPMFGLVIAFQDYSLDAGGFLSSNWVGLKHFKDFFSATQNTRIIVNTIMLNLYGLIFGFPAPIILALLLNELMNQRFKRIVQTISYLPYFISTVVTVAIFMKFVSYEDGIINVLIQKLGGDKVFFLNDPKYFRGLFTTMNIWKGVGWGTIIYLAALAGVDQELYEACYMDGGGRWRQTWHITLPGIRNTIAILFILNMGSMLDVGFESIILMYNPKLYKTADVIGSYVYRSAILEAKYSFSTAVGLFQSVIGLALVLLTNAVVKKFSEVSLW